LRKFKTVIKELKLISQRFVFTYIFPMVKKYHPYLPRKKRKLYNLAVIPKEMKMEEDMDKMH
jgi:hypothetical protein